MYYNVFIYCLDVWKTLLHGKPSQEFFQGDLYVWISENIMQRPNGRFKIMNWHLIFGVTIWTLWRCSNSRIFERNTSSTTAVVCQVYQLVAQITNSISVGVQHRKNENQWKNFHGLDHLMVGWNLMWIDRWRKEAIEQLLGVSWEVKMVAGWGVL